VHLTGVWCKDKEVFINHAALHLIQTEKEDFHHVAYAF
jgi:hypothetical protein